MEIILGAISAIAGAGATGTAAAAPLAVVGSAGSMAVPTFGTAAASGGGLLGLLGGGSAASSVLSGGMTVLSALRAMEAGKEKALDADLKAQETRNQIADERQAGARRRINLKDEMLSVLGQNDVTAAAAGIDLSYGFAADQRDATLARGAQEVSIDRATEEDRVTNLRQREANYRRLSRGARSGGRLAAALALGEGAVGLAGRYG